MLKWGSVLAILSIAFLIYPFTTATVPFPYCGCFFEWPSHKIYRRYIALYAQFSYIDLVE